MPKISLDQIIDSENVRKDYKDIEELADSILKRGQLEPTIMKKAEPKDDGTPMYEIVAGFRRHRAIKLLKEKGHNFNEMDAVIVTGDRLTIQLVENLQRSDLTSREREEGIALMVESGLSQKEVAAELSKRPDYISRHITAYKIRKTAEEAGADTADIETSALAEIATVKKQDIPMMVGFIKNGGGTREAARKIMTDYRGNKPEPSVPEKENLTETETMPEAPLDRDIDPLANAEILPEPVASLPPPHRKPISREDTNPDHRIIDLQIVFDRIYGYINRLKKFIESEGTETPEGIIAQHKIDAAYDIVAELHQVEGI